MRIRALLLLLALLSSPACEKKTSPKIDFASALQVLPQLNQNEQVLNVKIELAQGYHAYAPGEKVGVPISLSIEPKNGWKQEGQVIIPPGTEKTLGTLGKSQVLFGTFILKTSVNTGNGPLYGSIHIQICTEGLCDRPRVHTFKVEVASVNKR